MVTGLGSRRGADQTARDGDGLGVVEKGQDDERNPWICAHAQGFA